MRGFGIDASVPTEVAARVAVEVERHGYDSFWVNGSPHQGALDIITEASQVTGLELGVGVLPLTKIPIDEIISEVRERGLPQERLYLGVGSSRKPGALDEVRQAVETLDDELQVKATMGSVGPRMMALAGVVADAVIFSWSFAAEAARSRWILEESADGAGRDAPTIFSYVRCALLPQAADAVRERAEVYDAIPHYRRVFERHGVHAIDTVVTGSSREELVRGIEAEEAVLDRSVIRAIPADDSFDSIAELVEACAPLRG